MKHTFAIVLALALVILAFVLYWLNRHSVDLALTEIFGALFTGIKILFFVGVALGVAWAAIEIKHHSRLKVIGPDRSGHYKQAIIHKGEVVHLAQPNQAQLDPMQQLNMLKSVLAMQGQMSKLAQQTHVQEVETSETREIAGPAALPTNINYEDIRRQVPKNHILVGIGRLGIETKERAVGACLWIVGLSGTGKTSTTVLRVEERASAGHHFMGVDPHWFKPDSLTNAIKAYRSRFLMPIARSAEESNKVFKAFMTEFRARKAGLVPQPWTPITLLVDEVGALMDPTSTDEDERNFEEENAKMLPSIARVCGEEARNFEMGGIFISQRATGLAWLRKVALMVIVHQLLQESEKKLATNNDTAAMLDMKTWPIGRTYVFGVGFQEGPRTVQQPRFEVPEESVIESTLEAVDGPDTENVQSINSSDGRHATNVVEPVDRTLPFSMEKFKQAQKMLLARETQNKIICSVWNVQENSRQFRAAKEEFQLMLAYLASMASVEEG